ncbi:MAG: hypothetical protein A2293_02905 [Elusimicrobia bacterium RIFOXYB2_FULL_49_7]|nr:MAG: hypothetical protein A2293_02905 [Elusimicrobia bacterium RIFOXYB2_FULL_49_7]
MKTSVESLILSSKQHLESLFDSITDPILIIGPDYAIERLNAAAAHHSGGRFHDSLRKKCYERFHGRNMPCPECPFDLAFFRRKQDSVKMMRPKEGRERIWDMRYFPFLSKEGRVEAVVEHYVEVTEGEEAKAKLAEAYTGIKRDLGVAKKIQEALLPYRPPTVPGLLLQSYCRPAQEVGGDLIDFIKIDPARTGILIADVSGHGVPASLVAAMAKMSFYTHTANQLGSAQVMERVNRDLFHNLVMEYFVSALYTVYDATSGRLTYSRAGHPPALLLEKKTGRLRELSGSGFFLGMMKQGAFEEKQIRLQPGDRLLFYTDGVLYLQGPRKAWFDLRALKAFFRETRNRPLRTVKACLVAEMARSSRKAADDATFILLEVFSGRD